MKPPQPARRSPGRASLASAFASAVLLLTALTAVLTVPLSAAHANTLYGVTQGADPTLYTINPSSGSATKIGASGAVGAQVSSLTAGPDAAAALIAGTLNGDLFQIDRLSGVGTRIGGTGSTDALFGLSFFDGALYGLQGLPLGVQRLVQIDPLTGAATNLGDVQDADGNLVFGRGLTLFSGLLITADAGLGAGGDLFALDVTTGLATDLTADGVGIGVSGLSGLATLNKKLFAVNNDPAQLGLFTVDPDTAETTPVGGYDLRIGALAAAPATTIPEPGTLPLIGFAVLIGAPVIRRRARVTQGEK